MTSSMPMTSAAMTMLTMAATMVAMMLPSIAPTLWHTHRHLSAMRMPRVGQHTTFFAVGYASVWTTVGLAMFALPASRVAPWLTGLVILCAGAVQCSQWKANQLLRCRRTCVPAWVISGNVLANLRAGCEFGLGCALSCAAPMAVLVVVGLMDARMMLVITVVITAERVAPAGPRIARFTGAVALIAGLLVCVRAIH